MSNQKPAWAPDAIATTAGWVNPKTNELLASVRGLPGALPYIKGRIIHPVTKEVKAAVAGLVQQATEVVEEIQESASQIIEEVEAVVEKEPEAEVVEAPTAKKGVFAKKSKKK